MKHNSLKPVRRNKEQIIDDFNILAQRWKFANDSRRQVAYQNASSALCRVPGDQILSITEVKPKKRNPLGEIAPRRQVFISTNEVSDMLIISGIGAKTFSKIKEVLNTGTMTAAETARRWIQEYMSQPKELTKEEQILKDFKSIYGVGPSTAYRWLRQYNTIPISERPKPLTWVKEHVQLTQGQLIGLKYVQDLKKRVPRHYIDIIGLCIRVILAQAFGLRSYRMAVAGSYRRGALDSGDIDVVLSSTRFTLEQATKALQDAGLIVDIMGMSSRKTTAVCHCPSGQWFHFHLDLIFTTPEAWEPALLYFTGSKGFNTQMRDMAKRKGYILNQYGLFEREDTGQMYPLAITEREIFEKLDMTYVPPVCR
jgi:DNA polymerase/3'-5' exonuclease PolX